MVVVPLKHEMLPVVVELVKKFGCVMVAVADAKQPNASDTMML
jgi:hypothetical protein